MAPGGMRKRLRQHTGHTEARERMGLKVVREGMFYERPRLNPRRREACLPWGRLWRGAPIAELRAIYCRFLPAPSNPGAFPGGSARGPLGPPVAA